MKELSDPIPIVHKVMLGDALPGIEALCKHMKSRIAKAKKQTAEARVERINIAFDLFEYAEKDEVKQTIANINVDPVTKKKKEGRPKQAHRLAMEVIARACAVSDKTISRWVDDFFEVCTALKLIERDESENKVPVKNARTEFMDIVSINSKELHDWFEQLPIAKEIPVASDMTPKQIANAIKGVFEKHFFSDNGHVKLAPAARTEVIQNLAPVLKIIGLEILTIGKE